MYVHGVKNINDKKMVPKSKLTVFMREKERLKGRYSFAHKVRALESGRMSLTECYRVLYIEK